MAFVFVLFPLVFAGVAFLIPSNRLRPWTLPAAGALHLALSVYTVFFRADLLRTNGWLMLDAPGKLVLLVVSTLFFFCSLYSVGYLRLRENRGNRVFTCCLLLFLGMAGLVVWSHHLGLMWVAIEATTLSTAPLIYFNQNKKSLEATWKYLVIGSVGIAIALLGTYFLAYSTVPSGMKPTLQMDELLACAPGLSKGWFRAAFILLLVGYGTKMGLAPMHTWKPDAYGEAPGVIGAIFAGGVTSCAFLAFLRIYQLSAAAGEGDFTTKILLFMGLFSMIVAGLFILGQKDFKRLLAYSSVEHMGILIVGLGIGGPALYGTMLHVATNSMTKGVLFLSAGNIHRAYDSKNTDQVHGAISRLPFSGILFLAGFLAITGSPPFGPFVSEFSILTGAVSGGKFVTAGLFLLFLLVVFIGMGQTVLSVVQGRAPAGEIPGGYRDRFSTVFPVLVLMGVTLLLGLVIPAPLQNILKEAVVCLGGKA
jgi:hydrogenase-4 component F